MTTISAFVTSAVEAVDDDILRLLDKNHTSRDFDRAVALTRAAGIALAPTFVAFTPWTTLEGYLALLERLLELQLVESVPPVQLTIRLLVPEGSWLLKLPGFREKLLAFDPALLGYPWIHPDPRVDRLQQDLQAEVARCEQEGVARREVFAAIWRMAHEAAARCLASGKKADQCYKELQAACKGLALPASLIWFMIASLVIFTLLDLSIIANEAHLGGFLAGIVFGALSALASRLLRTTSGPKGEA